MKKGLNLESAIENACSYGLILPGFTVSPEHSMVLCEQGKEYFYGKKPVEKRKVEEEEEKQ